MLTFEILRAMLIRFANEPVEPDYSDPRYMPIREDRTNGGFRYQYHGRPEDYTAWISPEDYHSNVDYMALDIYKTGDHIDRLVFRVCATNAGMTYEYTFNFLEGQPAVEMRQSRGATVTGERVRFEKVRCINLVVFDLIELMLPPQIAAYRPKPGPYYPASTADKPCFACETNTIPYNWGTCSDCYNNVPVAAV